MANSRLLFQALIQLQVNTCMHTARFHTLIMDITKSWNGLENGTYERTGSTLPKALLYHCRLTFTDTTVSYMQSELCSALLYVYIKVAVY